jgi:predicted acylesterase/phospholipase RssA
VKQRQRLRSIAVVAWLVASVAGAAEPPPANDFALTISGGVSLGAYEAGLTWATVRFLRMVRAQEAGTPRFQPHLAAVTGASAGSINALLAAALWCQAPDSRADDGVDDNLMRDTWLPVGLDSLLPEDARLYSPVDGLLSSGALERVLEDLRAKVFTPNATRRFRPGCSVPLGFSVTRLEPEVRRIAGLPSVTQRFVVPLLFEVTPGGRVRLRHQPLPRGGEQAASALMLAESPDPEPPGLAVSSDAVSQALLSSAAFPLAFSPRELCDCATSCPDRHRVRRGTCPGPTADRPLTELTCAARSTPGRPLTLCRRPYVDGGVFDNAPVGLAMELAEATRSSRPWWPVTYIFVDPDVRRFESAATAAPAGPASGATLAGSLDLFAGLVATARNSELGRAARTLEGNRTSRGLLLEAAHENRQYARLHGVLSGLAQGRVEAAEALSALEAAPRPALTVAERLRRGRWLLSCVSRLSTETVGARAVALQATCARALRGEPGVDPLAEDPAQAARVGERLSPGELVDLATGLTEVFRDSHPLRQQVDLALGQPSRAGEERLRVHDIFRDGVELGACAFEYLAGELHGQVLGVLSPAQQARLRGALLEMMRQIEALSQATHLLANVVLDSQLQALESTPLLAVAGPAREVRESLRASPPGTLFSPEALARVVEAALAQLVAPEVAALQRAPDGTAPLQGDPALLAHRTRVLGMLVGLAPVFQQRAGALEALSARARALQGGGAAERRLYVSTRFAPLAGSQLGNFAAFLDRPLRELDYYAGIYDALHTIALQGCAGQDPYEPGVPVPVRRPLPADELDLTAPDTQRCVGRLMRASAERMGLFDSARARHVLTALAREELEATLGSRAVAAELVREPAWAWVEAPSGLGPEDPVAAALAAARSHRRPCREGDAEALCLADPGFDAFLEGLRGQGFRAREASMKLALEDPARWWGTTLRRVVDRATVVELQQGAEGASTARDGVRLALAAGQLWARRDVSSERTPRFELDPSSVPATAPPGSAAWKPWALHLVPYRVAFDAASGGVALAWVEPALRLSPRLSLLSQVEPLDYESENDRLSSTVGLRPTVHLGGVSLGLGPRASVHWTGGERRFDWGLVLHGAVLQDRLGVSVGVRESPFGDGRALRGLTVSLSLADLNGLAYWFTL